MISLLSLFRTTPNKALNIIEICYGLGLFFALHLVPDLIALLKNSAVTVKIIFEIV
jgi:hypothetical protein